MGGLITFSSCTGEPPAAAAAAAAAAGAQSMSLAAEAGAGSSTNCRCGGASDLVLDRKPASRTEEREYHYRTCYIPRALLFVFNDAVHASLRFDLFVLGNLENVCNNMKCASRPVTKELLQTLGC